MKSDFKDPGSDPGPDTQVNGTCSLTWSGITDGLGAMCNCSFCLLHGHRKSHWPLCIVPASSAERTTPYHRGERMARQTLEPRLG